MAPHSDPLTLVTFKWGDAYTAAHVNALARGLNRGIWPTDYRLVCVTDDPTGVECETFPLWPDHGENFKKGLRPFPSCYRRLKLFDGATTDAMGIARGSRVCSIDVDMVVVKHIAHYFERDEPFVGYGVMGARQKFVFNGSMWMHKAGAMQWMWDELRPGPDTLAANKAGYFGSDQSILSHKLVGQRNVTANWGKSDGFYAYRDIRGASLPDDARLVSFYGKNKPWTPEAQRLTPWILHHW